MLVGTYYSNTEFDEYGDKIPFYKITKYYDVFEVHDLRDNSVRGYDNLYDAMYSCKSVHGSGIGWLTHEHPDAIL